MCGLLQGDSGGPLLVKAADDKLEIVGKFNYGGKILTRDAASCQFKDKKGHYTISDTYSSTFRYYSRFALSENL